MLLVFNNSFFLIEFYSFFSFLVFCFSTDALNVPVRISVSGIEPAHCGTEEFDTENTICALNIRKQTSWDDFSKAVSQAVTNHFQAIASDGWRSLEDLSFNSAAESNIGLSASSILSVKLGINIGVIRKAKIGGFLEFVKSCKMKISLDFWLF